MSRASVRAPSMLTIAASLIAMNAMAQDVFKWIDENGIVNYGDALPDGVTIYERIVIAPAPAVTITQPRAAAAQRTEPETVAPAPEAVVVIAPEQQAAALPANAMTLADLDRACEAARERELAPLRTAAIAECKAAPRANPAYCERYYADFGDGGTSADGVVRPRMFDDLTECVVARQEHAIRRR